ncbi:MAG: esterase-like activity of phytase family protein, partial [Pseudomonadota bacterium]
MQPAELVGHAILPAPSFSAPPKDAPFDAFVTGKFLRADARVEVPLSVPGPLGMPTPFLGQPMQGLSGFAEQRHGDGSLYGVLDNGFGAKLNSPDILLSFVRLRPNFDTGSVEVVERVWLHDPDHLVPFRIAYEGTARRYLTGADFDPESLQVIGDEVWIGDEFGPYLISATLEGRITGVYPTTLDGEILRSPDHPALRVGVRPGEHWRVPRSGGFEGLLLQDGMLWAMLEKPI